MTRTISKSSTGSTLKTFSTILGYVFVFWIGLPAFLVATGLRLDMLWPIEIWDGGWVRFVAIACVAIGVLIVLASMLQLSLAGRGLPISHLPPSRLVADGVYRYVRHPIYIGYTLAFAGIAPLLDSFWMLFFSVPLLTLGWMAYALFLEEPILIERFGDAYRVYRSRTRLLWPIARRLASSPSRSSLTRWYWRAVNRLANATILIRRGNLILVTYGVFCALGALLTAVWLSAVLLGQGLPPSHLSLLLIGTAFATSVLAWAFWWIGNCRSLIHERWWGLGRIGFISYGGLAGVLLFPIAFAYRFGYPPLMLSDAIILSLFWCYAVGRIGCLSYGCCYGMPTDQRHGVVYENPNAKVIRKGDHRHVARHPTQLYSFGHAMLLIIVLNAMTWSSIPAGLITAMGLMLVGLGRTFTESYRDRERPVFERFTYGHLGSWITFFIGWLLLFVVRPDLDEAAPVPVTIDLLARSSEVWPFCLLAGLLILIVFGVHWRRVGCWFG